LNGHAVVDHSAQCVGAAHPDFDREVETYTRLSGL